MEITTTTAKTKLRNASNFVQYLLKGSETGLTCCTPIMDDPSFVATVNSLYQQQKREFYQEFSADRIKSWRERVLTDRDSAKVHNNRARILTRDDIFKSRARRVPSGTERANAVTQLVHRISATQLFENTRGQTGHQFQQMLPNIASAEQILHVLTGIRDAMPADRPAVFTLHKDTRKHNLHIQGWISPRAYDPESGCWKKLGAHFTKEEKAAGKKSRAESHREVDYFQSREGFLHLHATVNRLMQEAQLSFKHASDVKIPRVTDSHPFVQRLLQEYPKQAFIDGTIKDLAGVRSERVRQIIDMHGARAKAIQEKETLELKIEQQDEAFRAVVSTADEIASLFPLQQEYAEQQEQQAPEQIEHASSVATSISAVTGSRELQQQLKRSNFFDYTESALTSDIDDVFSALTDGPSQTTTTTHKEV
jgi:hypothetical protein